jgi:hypothetical protein
MSVGLGFVTEEGGDEGGTDALGVEAVAEGDSEGAAALGAADPTATDRGNSQKGMKRMLVKNFILLS